MTTPPVDDAKLSLRRLWVLMVTAFVDMIGFSLILPLLPLYATRFGADATAVGLLMSTFAFAQLVTAPLWGRLSDRIGRRPVIMIGQGLAGLAFLVFGLAESVVLLVLCRVVQGAGGGTIGVNQAYVGDVVGPTERAKALGWITACGSAGVMIGPAIASFSVRFSEAAPGLIAAAFCGLNLLFTWRWLPEPVRRRHHPDQPRQPLLPSIAAVITKPVATAHMLIWVYAVAMMAFMAMNTVLALYLAATFGVDERSIGWYYVALGALSVVMRGAVLGSAVRRFGEVRVLRVGAAMLAFGMAAAPWASHPLTFMAAIFFVPMGTALLFPCTTSLVSRHAKPERLGEMMGVQQAFGGSSRLIGPLWAGAVFQHVGMAQTFWLASALVVGASLLAWRLKPGQGDRRAVPDAPVHAKNQA